MTQHIRIPFLSALVLLMVFPLPGWAAQAENEIDWFVLVMELMAGLDQLSDGLKKAAGDTLKVMFAWSWPGKMKLS